MVSTPHADDSQLHHELQNCLDQYFLRVGPGALDIGIDSNEAPLGSISVLELESGINQLLQGTAQAIAMIRQESVRVVICPKGEVTPELVRGLVDEGWKGWRELEQFEAQILSARFEQGLAI
jgi:hypothetical protein